MASSSSPSSSNTSSSTSSSATIGTPSSNSSNTSSSHGGGGGTSNNNNGNGGSKMKSFWRRNAPSKFPAGIKPVNSSSAEAVLQVRGAQYPPTAYHEVQMSIAAAGGGAHFTAAKESTTFLQVSTPTSASSSSSSSGAAGRLRSSSTNDRTTIPSFDAWSHDDDDLLSEFEKTRLRASSVNAGNNNSIIAPHSGSSTSRTSPSPHTARHASSSSSAAGKPTSSSASSLKATSKESVVDSPIAAESLLSSTSSIDAKMDKFHRLLEAPTIDLEELRKLSWSGIPPKFRSVVWQLLMGYLPLNKERRKTTLERKRLEYADLLIQCFGENHTNNNESPNVDPKIFHQIQIDVPRTNKDIPLFQNKVTYHSLERVLYAWAIRHPASGYVQGINDLVTPFFVVFLSSTLGDISIETYDMSQVPLDILNQVEADCYWCLTKLLDGIQDHYTFAQPGIQRQVFKLKELIGRIDAPLHNHLQNQGVEFLQFAFRWMNCLLMRELPLSSTIRMWDTYLSEGPDAYSTFHLYVCGAFLMTWAKQLKAMEFQDLMVFLQGLPTRSWTFKEVELLLSEAFYYKSLFHNSPSHLGATIA